MALMNFHITSLINIDMYGTTYVFSKFRNKRRPKLGPILLDKYSKIPYTSEIMLDNFIENDFLAVLRPLNLMQSLLVCSKYSIRDNFITSNSCFYNCIGVFGLILSRCVGLYGLFTYITETDWKTLTLILNWTRFYDFFSYSFGFIINYYTNIKWSNTNIVLVLKTQHVLRALKITAKDLFIFTLQNWVSVIIINGIIVGSIIYMTYMFYPYTNIFHMSYYYFSMTFDVNVMYANFMIKLTCKALCVWTEDARKAGNSKSESYWECMFDVYLNILQIYRTVEKTFKHLILFYTIFVVSHGLVNIAVIIQMKLFIDGGGLRLAILIVITQIWLVKNIVILTSLSITCERFYTATRDVQSTMIMFSKRRGLSETQRKVCKKVLRVQNAAFKKMDACGVFIIDATLPLRLFSFITSHTVVLLQFSM